MVHQRVPILYFQSQFPLSKINGISSKKQDRRYSDPKARNGSKTKKFKIRRIPKIS